MTAHLGGLDQVAAADGELEVIAGRREAAVLAGDLTLRDDDQIGSLKDGPLLTVVPSRRLVLATHGFVSPSDYANLLSRLASAFSPGPQTKER